MAELQHMDEHRGSRRKGSDLVVVLVVVSLLSFLVCVLCYVFCLFIIWLLCLANHEGIDLVICQPGAAPFAAASRSARQS